MKVLLSIFVTLGSLNAHATACNTFNDAMDVAASKISAFSPNHGPIAMTFSCGVAISCNSAGTFEVIATYDDNTGIKKTMHCKFLDEKTCVPTVCVEDSARTYP